MIERGPNGRLHTSGCSASDHYRTHDLGAFCRARAVWAVTPTRVRLALLTALLVALTVATAAAVALLFGGGVG